MSRAQRLAPDQELGSPIAAALDSLAGSSQLCNNPFLLLQALQAGHIYEIAGKVARQVGT